jgi:hypothetical protein
MTLIWNTEKLQNKNISLLLLPYRASLLYLNLTALGNNMASSRRVMLNLNLCFVVNAHVLDHTKMSGQQVRKVQRRRFEEVGLFNQTHTRV